MKTENVNQNVFLTGTIETGRVGGQLHKTSWCPIAFHLMRTKVFIVKPKLVKGTPKHLPQVVTFPPFHCREDFELVLKNNLNHEQTLSKHSLVTTTGSQRCSSINTPLYNIDAIIRYFETKIKNILYPFTVTNNLIIAAATSASGVRVFGNITQVINLAL